MTDEKGVILVVDDEPDVLITMERQLSRLLPECTILAAADADAALALLAAHPIKVALIDYRIPHMDGLALSEAIRRQTDGVQLILISATIGMLSLPGGPQAHGLFATMPKPWTSEELVEVVRAALVVSRS